MSITLPLRQRLMRRVLSTLLPFLLYQILLTNAYMQSVRIEEIPFSLGAKTDENRQQAGGLAAQPIESKSGKGIHAITNLEQRRAFFNIFKVPYIICFFAAKGKWPFVPPFMQPRVDAAARTFFNQNDSAIIQFCRKWIQIKECFRPIFATATTLSDVESIAPARGTPCTCANLVTNEPMVYFDKDHIGNVSRETILNTIEFLENFLPPPNKNTKKPRKKIQVRGRLDEVDID